METPLETAQETAPRPSRKASGPAMLAFYVVAALLCATFWALVVTYHAAIIGGLLAAVRFVSHPLTLFGLVLVRWI